MYEVICDRCAFVLKVKPDRRYFESTYKQCPKCKANIDVRNGSLLTTFSKSAQYHQACGMCGADDPELETIEFQDGRYAIAHVHHCHVCDYLSPPAKLEQRIAYVEAMIHGEQPDK